MASTAARRRRSDMAETVEALGEKWEGYNPLEHPMLTDPYPVYASVRRATPVFYTPQFDVWIVTRYSDISDVLQRPDLFSATNATNPVQEVANEAVEVLESRGFRYPKSVFSSDPPYHTRMRKLVRRAFTARHVAGLEPFVRAWVGGEIDRLEPLGEADLIREIFSPLPGFVMLKLLGFPDDRAEVIRAGSRDRNIFMVGWQAPQEQVETTRGLVRFMEFARELIEERARAPREDLTSELLRVRGGDDSVLSLHEITSLLITFFTAGSETTTAFLGNAFYHLLRDRSAWDELVADPSLAPTAVEELLRFDPPIHGWRRRALEDVEIGGVRIPEGSELLLLLSSAGRDESVFPNPDTLDFRRENAQDHLAFSHGIHFCLGAPLARLESRVVVELLTARLPGMRLVDDRPGPHFPNIIFRVPLELPVEWPTPGVRGGVGGGDQGSASP
jgi:cytochrome P450